MIGLLTNKRPTDSLLNASIKSARAFLLAHEPEQVLHGLLDVAALRKAHQRLRFQLRVSRNQILAWRIDTQIFTPNAGSCRERSLGYTLSR